MEVNIAKGYFWKVKGLKGRIGIETLQQALSTQAECSACGCDDCLGYWTNINTVTGELMVVYIGMDETTPVLIIEPYDEGIANLKTAKALRDAS